MLLLSWPQLEVDGNTPSSGGLWESHWDWGLWEPRPVALFRTSFQIMLKTTENNSANSRPSSEIRHVHAPCDL